MVYRGHLRWAACFAALSLAAVLCGCDSHTSVARHGVANGGQERPKPQDVAGDLAQATEVSPDQEELCAPFKTLSPPESDQPDAATAKSLAKCDTEALLYGIGTQKDVVRARQCAYVSGDAGDAIDGSAALTTIYANGWGVKRDLALASHFACEIDAADAEMEGRLKHLAELKAGGSEAKPFDICDDVTSGNWQGICNGRDERIKDVARDHAINQVLSGWSEQERAAYKRFVVVEDAYSEAHNGEVDASGSARVVEWQEADREIRDRALEMLRRLNRDDGFSATPAQRTASDQELNLTYQRVMKADADAWESMGTVKPEDVRTAQRGWVKYRDAWLELATAKGRSATFVDGLAVALTDERAHDLRCLMQFAKPGENCSTEESASAQ